MKHERVICAASLLSLVLALPGCQDSQAQEGDSEWPLEIDSEGTRIVLYQPEPDVLQDDEMTARAAVSVQRPSDADPVFGALWLRERVATDRDARTVTVLDIEVSRATFPHATPEQESELTGMVQREIPKLHHTFSLDQLEATLDQVEERRGTTDGFETAPPRIVFATTPTVLVTIDGEPQMQKVEGSDVMRVVNTPFVILFEPKGKSYHLKQDRRWSRASQIEGPWLDEAEPPASVTAALPPAQFETDEDGPAPRGDAQVLVATQPTELLVSDGEPKWTPVEGNDLLYLANSDNDVFLDVASQQHYVVFSGRWYKSASLEKGPWTWVPADDLPAAFAQIPPGSERGDVRAFVAGTEEARDAVLDASVPQTSAIARDGTQCHVTYDGDPKFAAIAGTKLRYAVNTADAVIELDEHYFCCEEGVWFTADGPLGPWTVCTSVPSEIYTIPPSCPVYPVTYVYVYDSTPDFVYVGYLPGYTGCYVYGPTIVYGTGWHYPGWYGTVYYPRPCTWGFAARYDPWGCDWIFGPSFGWGVSPAWFSLGFGWGHPGWWGPGGFHCNHFDLHAHTVHFHPPLPHKVAQNHRVNPIQTHVGHHNIYKRTQNNARNAALPARAVAEVRTRTATAIPNDVFVDREGNVLRRTQAGWEERHSAGWKRSERLAGAAPPTAPSPAARPPSRTIQPPRVSGSKEAAAQGKREPDAPPEPVPPQPASSSRSRAEPAQPARPPSRDDVERMHRSREEGNARASGFHERARGKSEPRAAPRGGRRP